MRIYGDEINNTARSPMGIDEGEQFLTTTLGNLGGANRAGPYAGAGLQTAVMRSIVFCGTENLDSLNVFLLETEAG